MSGPLRIGLVMQGGAGWMGGAEYVKNLALALAAMRAEGERSLEVHLFAGGSLDDGFREQLADAGTVFHEGLLQRRDSMAQRASSLVRRVILRQANARIRDLLRANGIHFLYPLTYDNLHTIGVALPIGGALGPTRWAGWIPDFQHKHMPQLFSPAEIVKRDAGIAALARDAKTIVLSSETAAADFRQLYPNSPARTEILRFHTHPSPAWFEGHPEVVQRRFHLPERFFLVSNQFWQHKNHGVVFEALALLQARGLRPHVVCTGQTGDFRDKGYFNSLLRRLHELGVAEQVHILGLIERVEQIQLMRRSLAVIQPSLFEGWSTVIEDARALGKPVLVSDLAVHREQNAPGSRFFAKDSSGELADVIAAALPELEPGPDHEREAAARTAAEKAMLTYGRRFLEIVETALR